MVRIFWRRSICEGSILVDHFPLAVSRYVLQCCQMSHTLTIRLTEDLLTWLKGRSRETGVPMGKIVRDQLETAKASGGKQKFMRHVGALSGPPDLSSRKGYSKR